MRDACFLVRAHAAGHVSFARFLRSPHIFLARSTVTLARAERSCTSGWERDRNLCRVSERGGSMQD
jgi:hypothetical protein